MSAVFSKNAVDAMNASQSCARQLGHDHVGSEHIFLSLLAIPKCQACRRLEGLGLSLSELAESMRAMISGNSKGVLQRGPLPLTSRTRKVLEIAERIVRLCAEPLCFEAILQRLFRGYALTMNFEQYVLVGSTLRSYLAWLKDSGELAVSFEDGMLLWRRA